MKRLAHEVLKKLVRRIGARAHINFLELAYDQLGILKYEDEVRSGEEFFLGSFAKKYLPAEPVIFDVGANSGDYSALALRHFPRAKIIAFEPSSKAAQQVKSRFGSTVECIQAALGSDSGTVTLYNYAADTGSTHGSIHRGVFEEIHQTSDISQEQCDVTTLDRFCSSEEINRIHLLKIDTEGNELDVLRGAQSLLRENHVDLIQFEFNEMNVVSRVFLKDFYNLLPNYRLFRLDTGRVIPLGAYDPRNEIFKFQNIAAAREQLFASDGPIP